MSTSKTWQYNLKCQNKQKKRRIKNFQMFATVYFRFLFYMNIWPNV